MHGLVALDAAGAVIRPAILWNDGRTAAECAEIEERVGLERLIALHRQPGADRLHRAEAAVAAPARARGVRAHRADHAAQGLRAPAALRRARDRHGRRVGDAAARRRAAGAGATRCSTRSSSTAPGCRGCSSRRRSRARRRDGVPVAAGRRRPGRGRAGRRRRPPGAALDRARHERRRVRRAARVRGRRARARARVLPRRARRLARDGRDALRRRLAAVAARHRRRPGAAFGELVGEAAALGARAPRGSRSCPTSPASARRTPTPTRAARSPACALRHDRGALVRAVLEGVAYGLRDSLDLLRELGVAPERGRVSGGGARSELWLRIIASVLELPLERPGRGGGRRVRRGAARRRRGRRLGPTSRPPWRRACGSRGEVEPEPARGSSRTPRGASASARSTRRCGGCAESRDGRRPRAVLAARRGSCAPPARAGAASERRERAPGDGRGARRAARSRRRGRSGRPCPARA